MTVVLAVLLAMALDALLGEPRRWHPLVGFGRLVQWLERRLYGDAIWRGAVAVLLLLVPFVLAAYGLSLHAHPLLLGSVALYLAVGWRSLGDHARQVRNALQAGDLDEARRRTGYMVSRDTAALDETGAAKATVESVLENGNDAVFGAVFWFVLGGVPGVVLYRLANTLDAMWGYRNARYNRFGRVAARLDDLLNYLPARLTALGYALVGNAGRALRCWRAQGTRWKSPNAGPVMAAGAGSLGVALGGAVSYHGQPQARPPLGEGAPAGAGHIDAALRLLNRTLVLWLAVLTIGGLAIDGLGR